MFDFNKAVYEAAHFEPDAKDIKRINDMVAKANGDDLKLQTLATKMVNSIKQADKMERRYKAALQICGNSSPVTDAFRAGCLQMGINIGGTSNNIVDTEEEENDNDNGNTPENSIFTTDNAPDTTSNNINQDVDSLNDDELTQKAIEKFNQENPDSIITDEFVDDIDFLKKLPFEYSKKLLQLRKQIFSVLIPQTVTNIFKDEVLANKYHNQAGFRYVKKYYNKRLELVSIDLKNGLVTINDFLGDYDHSITAEKRGLTAFVKYTYSLIQQTCAITKIDIKLREANSFYGKLVPSDIKEEVAKNVLKIINDYCQRAQAKLNKEFPEIQKKIEQYIRICESLYGAKREIDPKNYERWGVNKENKEPRFYFEGNSKLEKLYQKLTDLICEKFNVDDEYDTDWPGFSLKIDFDDNTVIFTPYSMGQKDAYDIIYAKFDRYRGNYNHVKTVPKNRYNGMTYKQECIALEKWLKSKFGKNNVTSNIQNEKIDSYDRLEHYKDTYYKIPMDVIQRVLNF